MSEKQVNIKITASTKDFDNAIQKAQKQIEGLADAIDKLGSSKFGGKIEDQFNGLVTAIKEIETRVASMLDSLGNVNNTKLGKVEDEVNDITEAVDKFSTKAKDMVDTLDKVDKQELNGLENEVNNVRDVVDKMDKEVRVASDNMVDNFKDVTTNIDRAGNSIDDLAKKFKNADGSINYDNILKYAGSVENADKIMKELLESQGKLNKAINEVDTKKINDYYESLTNIKDVASKVENLLQNTFDNIKGKVNLDFNGKDGNKGLASNITEGLLTGAIAGKTMENAIEGVTSELKDMTKQMEGLSAPEQLIQPFVELSKGFEKVQGDMDALVKRYAELDEEQKKLTKSQEEFKNSNDRTNKAIDLAEKYMYEYAEQAKEIDKAIEKAREAQEEYAEDSTKFEAQLSAITDRMEEQKEVVDQLGKEYDKAVEEVNRYAKASEYVNKLAEEGIDKNTGVRFTDGNYTIAWSSLEHALEVVNVQFEKAKQNAAELGDELSKENNSLNVLEKEREAIEKQKNALDEQYKAVGKTEEEIEQMTEAWQTATKNAEKFQYLMTKLRDIGIDEAINMEFIKKNFKEATEEAEKLEKQMAEVTEEYLKLNQTAQGEVGEFNKKYEAYKKLSDSVKEYLKDEEKSILLREKVAKSFEKTADAMEKVYAGASKYNNADLITETLQEAAKYVKELDLVSTENLQSDLERLGKIIEDKTDKIKRFKELNKEFGSEASKAGYGLEKQSESLRDFADSTGFVLEATNTLKKAWGDISAAGEDHLKIRERSELLDDYGDKLKKNIAIIKSHHKELKTLDEIYEKATDKEKATIDDYKAWEKNEAKLREYNDALRDYFSILKDTNGQVDSKFLDELGKFDVKKFIADFDKMGTSSMVLSKQINAVKIELLESIKAYKENAKAAVENAEAALEQAKNEKKIAESQEDRLKAVEKIKKAEEDLANAKEKLKNYDKEGLETLRDQIKEYNRLAEAMREIGMAAKDIEKADISKFDKSLASMLDRLDTFGNDIPKTFADLKEDISAVFSDMDSLDFGDALDGLKEIGAGVLSKIPGEAKAAAAAIAGITIALKECAEEGVSQFTRGMETLSGALSGIVGIARDIGQEIGDAFSNITGMELDFSSMMEIPVNFESQMAKVGAIAGATGDDFKELEAEARRLGATTRYSATEVAEAMEYMGMAGWTNTQILAKSKDGLSALESVLKLATVAQMDLGQASDFVTDGLTALGMEAEEASYMVDILAKASTSSNTTVAQMQRAFTNCAPVAGTLGINIKDLSMALGLMADKGVKGAKAGTALKNLMANMSAPTEKQLEYIKEFNLQGAQQDIVNGRLLDGLKKFKSALSSLTPQQQNAVITTIAGKEALSGISALLNTTEEDLNELESALNNCDGAAKNMADGFDDTLEGALKGLASAMQETLLQLRDMTKEAEDSIKNIVNDIADFFHILNGFKESSSGLTGLAGAFEHLEETTQKWGDNIADGLEKAIGAIDNFINGPIFDDILQAGTNIINGIADGIKRAAKDGTLDSAISGAIRKIATWFSENLDTIVEVGKEIIEAISKGISENSDEIGEVIKTVMEMQTEIDKAIAKEKWKLIGQNLISFICEGIVSKTSVFVSAFTGFFEGAIGDIASAFEDLIVNKLSPMLLDPIAILGESIGNFLKEVLLSALERAFDIDLSYFKDFNIFKPSSWFGDKDNKKNKSNKKSNSSNKGKKDSSSGSGISDMWSNFKKEIESWGKEFDNIKKNIESWGKGFNLWEAISDWFKEGEEVSANIRKSIAGLWTNNIEPEFGKLKKNISSWGTNVSNDISDAWTNIKDTLDSWGDGISEWSSNTGTWFSNSWSSAKEELSQWKTGISEWGTETGEELSKAGNDIKIFFTETLPGYFDPEKLGSALGTFTGTIAKGAVDAWNALDEWGNELYIKGSEAAIKYSDGIRDFFIELPDKISTWLTDAWTAVDTWGENLYIKGSEAAIKYSDGIRDFFAELPGKISTWLTNAWTAVDTWGENLYTKGSEAAIKYSNGIRDYFAELYNKISTWLTDAWKAVDEWGTDLYTKGSEAAIKYSDGIRDFFVQLPGKITTWLSNATKSFTKWCKELYTKGKEAINNLAKGISEGLRQLPSKITAGLSSGKKAVTTWGNDVKKSASSAGKNIVNGIFSGMNGFKSTITSWCSRFKSSFLSSFKKAFGIHSPSTVMRDEVGVNLALGIEEGLNSGTGNIAQTAGNIVSSVKSGLGDIWSNIFSGNISSTDLVNISAEGIDQAGMALRSLSVTLMGASEAVDQAGMAFKSFSMTLAQMSETLQVNNKEFMSLGASFANVSEITNAIRAAFMSIANIINNQVTNARNALTSQFLSMAAVARTQMVNISNIVRNQAVAWNNIIANQAKNARDNLTRQFISMAKVASTQMGKVTSAVRSSMNQVSVAASRGITISTNYAMPSANALYAANNASTLSLGGNTGALAYGASSAMSTGGGITSNGGGMSDNIVIEVPLYLDGKVIARATAKHMDNEIKTMNKRENRKRGAK